jgi:hypothetical protein
MYTTAPTGWARAGTIAAGCIAVVFAVLVPASPAFADVDSISGGATGVSITGDLGTIPPTPTVSLSANETSPPSALLPSSLPFNVFSTGPLAVATSAGKLAGEDPAGFVEARALVQTVVLGPNVATAMSIASSCTADDRGATGATVIEGGMLNGQPFPPTPTPPPNTVIAVPGIGTVTLNEQRATTSVGPTGGVSRRLVVNAVHARFSSTAAGGILPREQTAEAVIGQAVCEAASTETSVPSTTTVTTPSPTTATVAGSRRALAETGADNALPLGLLALGSGGLLRLALRKGEGVTSR